MSEESLEIQLHSGKTHTWVQPQHYPDGSPLLHEGNSGVTPDYVDTMLLRPSSLDTFVQAMFYVDACRERGYPISKLIFPHVMGGRQDRLNSTGDFLFTLKSVAKMINDRNFDKVVVLDPHSNVTPALIDRCEVHTIADVMIQTRAFNEKSWNNHYLKYDGVIAPDAGAASRAFGVAQHLGVELFQATKHRDVTTGRLGTAHCILPKNKHYLVVDDICDGGATFFTLAEIISGLESTADLFVTHGIFSRGVGRLLGVYRNIHTTNSVLNALQYKSEHVQIHDFLKGL